MSLALLAALALASSSKYDVFLGMPEKTAQEVRGMVQTMKTVQGADWTPRVEATTSVSRDTLVMWSWPLKGNHGIGLQLYAPNGQFKTRLEDSNIPAALAAVCGNRYVVGGGNTLRVWDARQNYRLIVRKTFPSLSQFARLSCTRNILTAEEGTSYEVGPWRTVLRLKIPSLLPAPGPIASSPQYDLQLGLSALEWQAILANTLGKVSVCYAVTQKLSTASGDTLVRWSSTPGLDPKGRMGWACRCTARMASFANGFRTRPGSTAPSCCVGLIWWAETIRSGSGMLGKIIRWSPAGLFPISRRSHG